MAFEGAQAQGDWRLLIDNLLDRASNSNLTGDRGLIGGHRNRGRILAGARPEDTYDVIVLGSGAGGLAAALAARELGLSPLLIEKSELLGGGTCLSYGLVWVGGNHLSTGDGYDDSADDVEEYATFLCGGQCDDAKLRAFLTEAPKMLRFFEDAGIRFKIVKGVPDHYYGIAPGGRAEGRSLEAELISGFELGALRHKIVLPPIAPYFVTAEEQISWGGMNRVWEWDKELVAERRKADMRGMGVALSCRFLKALSDRDVPIRTGARVARLVVGGDRVGGVELEDGAILAARRGVVIATGGYEANPGMMRNFENVPGWQNQSPDTVTGDGLVLGAELGGAIRMIQNNMQLFLSLRIPDPAGGPPRIRLAGIIELCSPHTLVVNREGNRFADESYFQGMVPMLRSFDIARHDYVNLPCFLVFDRQYAETYSFAGLEPGGEMPPWVSRAESLGELAEKLDIDPGNLQKSVERFNGFAAEGRDHDFQRGEKKWRLTRDAGPDERNHSLGPVDAAPFYGVRLYPTGSGSAGLLTDVSARVLHQRGHPIAGLYATGNATARDEYGAGYQAGQSLSSAMTFGLLAARHMAGETRDD